MYTGRFAPSPTGPLHFGSLVAALGSYLDARSRGGRWLVRIEDIDPPREVAGAADDILRTLEVFGLHWDGEVLYQSTRIEAYCVALDRLRQVGQAYDCGCSRRDVAEAGIPGIDGPVYPGTCRAGLPAGKEARAVRVRTDDSSIDFSDRLQGWTEQRLDTLCGDFVIRRADGLFAYQLAVVVDDAFQGVTDIVRGADLLDSTPRQIHLIRLLGLDQPSHAHLPLVTDAQGNKLSKQTGARPLDTDRPQTALVEALRFLGHEPPDEIISVPPVELLQWAVGNWNLARVSKRVSCHP